MSLQRPDLTGKDSFHLFEMDVGGRVYRYCDGPTDQTVTDNASRSFVYRRGLGFSPISVGSGVGTEASATITVNDPTDWASLESAGDYLDQRKATIRRFFVGQKLEETGLILSGLTGGIQYGATEEPLTLTVRRGLRSGSLVVPRPLAVVDLITWPNSTGGGAPSTWSHDERIRGASYPLLFGYGGDRAGTSATPRPVAPALIVKESDDAADTADLLLVAGHRITASQVTIFDYSDALLSVIASIAVTHQKDGLGRTCAVVDTAGSALAPIAKGKAYYQGHTAALGGGLADPRTGSLLRGAGSVLRYMLETYTDADIDGPRMDAAADALDAYKIDCAIYQPTQAVDWVNSELIPLLPVTLRQSEAGIYPQIWKWDAEKTASVNHIDADKGQCRRVGALVRSGDVKNEFAIQYRQDAATGNFGHTASLTGDVGFQRGGLGEDQGSTDSRTYGSRLCAASQARWGVLPAGVLQSGILWDAATANLVLQWMAARDAWPRRVVRYEAEPDWEYLSLGDVLRVTDAEVSLTAHLAIVADLTPGPRSVLLDLVLLDRP